MERQKERTARVDEARKQLVIALREHGDLADAVETLQGSELIEVLDYLDSVRFRMIEAMNTLKGITRGEY